MEVARLKIFVSSGIPQLSGTSRPSKIASHRNAMRMDPKPSDMTPMSGALTIAPLLVNIDTMAIEVPAWAPPGMWPALLNMVGNSVESPKPKTCETEADAPKGDAARQTGGQRNQT